MSRILVHITHGPENPTRAALGLLVAKAALDEGHEVSVFLAGDAVTLLRNAVLDHLVGLGTGRLRDSFDAVASGCQRIYVSKMSASARGLGDEDLLNKPAEFATPQMLVRLALDHDRMFNY